MLSAPAHIPAITPTSFGDGVGRAGLDPRRLDRHLLGDDLRQPGLLGQPEQRHQPGMRHEIVLVEACRAGGEPVGDSH